MDIKKAKVKIVNIRAATERVHILGFASLYLPDNFIHNFFVHPDFLKRGVGHLLLDASIVQMNTPVRLKCLSENHNVMKFYEKNGWKKVVEEERLREKYWVMA
ncbi:GNAT family N-acetyltransferase [Paenibacillus dendritiformis]|uniref:Acetyltransferase n=1 Tax=Paenibacillus dendritiformis C454 TaxID=1131935 RepID=H3SNV6_9BACL|nr:GNAT family N-acetyltransferase [Paenibacillus dendritiformis]EHQ59249.1 acetyltransferase [Paenibacillus dendritiformis C454]CAH8771984.1 GNAT family N-acetyltransferase [Paenibacillus dendritiformis]